MRSNHEAPHERPGFVIAIAASAGGIPAISEVLEELPSDLPAAVLVLLHMSPHHKSHLTEILARRTRLKVKTAVEGDPIQPGMVYVARPDCHLVVSEPGRLALTQGAKVNFVRPSADPLFASVAEHYGSRAILIVLTGYGRNGAACLPRAKELGATILAQDEATSAHFSMPQAAIATGAVDEVLPLSQIAGRLVELVDRDHSIV